ncbi:MAG: manganese ABC transporter permease [Chloroflexi bacterium RBG_16_47_49]|nr:MAG: manganese ABC transporter permease [Chloroflexi bacterium RBG_16_47_49]
MLDWILLPWHYAFMVRALIGSILVGSLCAIVGTYVVLRGMAFFGDALAHAILPGVAIGYLVGDGARQPLFWWAMLAAIISSLGIGTIGKSVKIREDTAIGIIFAGMFALGIALISSVQNYTNDLSHFLFGDVLGISQSDLGRISIFGGLIILIIIIFYKEFMVISFDPILAITLRLPVKALDYLLMILIAITIVVSLQTVGIALMVAMLITPTATAYLLSRRLPVMMVMASVIASISGVIGLYFSYYVNIASGAAIVLTATAFFLVVWMIKILTKTIKGYKYSIIE